MKSLKLNFTIVALFVIALTTLSISTSYAQQKQKCNSSAKHPSGEQIQMQKIAFFTAELQLTTQEAEKFWPLYNKLWEERIRARKETMVALHKLTQAVEAEPAKGDSEIKKLSEIYLATYAMESELLKEHFSEFEKILPVKKAAKILYTEERFRRVLIKQLRHHSPSHQGASARN